MVFPAAACKEVDALTDRIELLKDMFVHRKVQQKNRLPKSEPRAMAQIWSQQGLDDLERSVLRLRWMLTQEQPLVYPEEKIALVRTVPVIPELFTTQEWDALTAKYYIHEQGKVCNITPEYSRLLCRGFENVLAEIAAKKQIPDLQEEDVRYLTALESTLHAISDFAEAYRQEAIRIGNHVVAESFSHIPAKPPRSFLEALQFLRLLHYCLWASFQYHNTLGRFDQYMLPWLEADLAAGMTEAEALELVEEFFLSCNRDSDLYTGMQQGDNGQSLVLGGIDAEGNDCFNLLSQLCMTACCELKLIDPKINLRVHSGTPLSVFEAGTQMTKLGLGFPQYANDDVIIPCLKQWGYAPQDAHNYSVAACWELIIPGKGMDIPNIAALSFPQAILEALAKDDTETFDAFAQNVRQSIHRQADSIIRGIGTVYMEPAPLLSLMMEGCLEQIRDISQGGFYNNYGIHGTGLATAVDSMAAVEYYVYQTKQFTLPQLKQMLAADFQGYEKELALLRNSERKFGNDIDAVDTLAVQLLDWFADAVAGHTNRRGGIYRAGTGSAMYYLWYGGTLGATPDGRRAGEGLPCNYSPSLFVRTSGPLSVFRSFSKPNLYRVANGGPLTVELHDSVFRSEESIRKVALCVQEYMRMGGHQLQINAVNRDILLDAKAHPERHKNLIVRVWGWSGYFVELDEAYQDHIIRRAEMVF